MNHIPAQEVPEMDRRRETERRARYRTASCGSLLSAGRRLGDRRRSLRKLIHAALRILKLSGAVPGPVPGKIVDCSHEGVRLELPFTDEQLPVRVSEQLLIELRDEDLPPVNVFVEVIWVQPLGGKLLAGCQFQLALVLKQLAVLQRLCEQMPPSQVSRIKGLAELFHHSV